MLHWVDIPSRGLIYFQDTYFNIDYLEFKKQRQSKEIMASEM